MRQSSNETEVALYHKKMLVDRNKELLTELDILEKQFSDLRVQMHILKNKMVPVNDELSIINAMLFKINNDPDFL